jgi:hypothetical protein
MHDDGTGLSTGTKVGYGLTAAWMVGVLVYTDGDFRHPVFDTLFIVPLAAWVVGLTVARLVRRFRGSR